MLDARLAARSRRRTCSTLTGSGRVDLAGEIPVVQRRLQAGEGQFPAAFTSYMQITLATSVLGDRQHQR